jgi:hypothetical protein
MLYGTEVAVCSEINKRNKYTKQINKAKQAWTG